MGSTSSIRLTRRTPSAAAPHLRLPSSRRARRWRCASASRPSARALGRRGALGAGRLAGRRRCGSSGVAIVLATGGGERGASASPRRRSSRKLGPAAPAPAVDSAHPGLLKRSVGGVTYPSWQDEFPWQASGAREDKVDGRRTVTVFYENPAHAADRLHDRRRQGARRALGARACARAPSTTSCSSAAARTIVTWRRGGHTCVLSGPASVPRERLLALASWSADRDLLEFWP